MDKMPKERKYERMGSERTSYDLVGRVHLDYLELYRKYNYEERHSYRLDYIGEMEVGEKKVAYEGSLDRLYNFDFEKFCEYNIQDVLLLAKMDKKLQFIDLANTIAHDNTVLLPVTMGAVATTEQAIINEAHRRNMVVPDRTKTRESDSLWGHTAAGAYVAFPKKGLHHWIGSMDLNSLYPSVFRALNMAPETIVGQLRQEYTEEEITNNMNEFILKKKMIMISTTLIEVGINIPSASLMIIESANKFGLAQLHQLRGRIARNNIQSHCVLLSDNTISEEAKTRLAVIKNSNDGFEIAEQDLKLRGRGDFFGTNQSGLPSWRFFDPQTDFELINQNGLKITQEYYNNKIYVADFFFTTCQDICPIMTKNMYKLQEELKNENDILFLSHTVIPEVDTVEQLKKYAIENNVDDSKWNLVTGEKRQIYDLARKSYLAVEDAKYGKFDMIHTENFMLIDKQKQIRGFYDGTKDEEIEQLISDIKILKKLNYD